MLLAPESVFDLGNICLVAYRFQEFLVYRRVNQMNEWLLWPDISQVNSTTMLKEQLT